jgi:hypothetical protein
MLTMAGWSAPFGAARPDASTTLLGRGGARNDRTLTVLGSIPPARERVALTPRQPSWDAERWGWPYQPAFGGPHLHLEPSDGDHRRVLAVLAHLRGEG